MLCWLAESKESGLGYIKLECDLIGVMARRKTFREQKERVAQPKRISGERTPNDRGQVEDDGKRRERKPTSTSARAALIDAEQP